jgi:hypothetical protein
LACIAAIVPDLRQSRTETMRKRWRLTSAERDRMADPTCRRLAGRTDRIGRHDSSQRRANRGNVDKAIFESLDTFECAAASSPGAFPERLRPPVNPIEPCSGAKASIGDMRMKMRSLSSVLAAGVFLASCAQAAAKPYHWSHDGQYPLPPGLSNQTAQPECGFAATESWGPNGFQWCDPKNIYRTPPVAYPNRRR